MGLIFIISPSRLILIPKLTENTIRTDTNGLYYMCARNYNTNIERLISQDIPIGIAANIVNAVLYFQEGDILSGLLNVAGAVIGIGGLSSAIGAVKGICTLADGNTATVAIDAIPSNKAEFEKIFR